MRELFGIPMGALAAVLAAALGVAAAVVATLALRNRIFVRLGVRNVGRRRARTTLIVIGLMLGTTIIAAALATGDTMSHTIRSTAVAALGNTDELVTARGARLEPGLSEAAGSVPATPFSEAAFAPVERAARRSGLVDGVAPAILQPVAVQAPRTRQSEPRVGLFAADPARMAGFGTIRAADGTRQSLAALRPGELFLTSDAADELDVRAGDSVRVLAGPHALTAVVTAVVDFDGAGTDGPALLMPLAAAQTLLGEPGQIDHILISNRGDALAGAELTNAVVGALQPTLAGLGLQAEPTKQDALEAADEAGSAFMSVFTTFGSFSIAAGILLIFLIFVMLAAERRRELGIARALGTRRAHLVQMFLFEGAAYDVLAAAVGALVGVGVAFGMVLVMAGAFASTGDLEIAFSVTPRSLVVAYALGVLLTLAVVTLSARRVSRMNIVTAIRNLPEPPERGRRRRLAMPALGVVAGAALTASGLDTSEAAPFYLGVGLLILGLVSLARLAGVADRTARSVGGALLVAFFVLPIGDWLGAELKTDFSVFVLAGLMIVIGATWLIVYNAEPLLRLLTRAIGRLPGIAPVLKMAMAYPLRSLFRTGVTLAMFTLVVLTLVVGATTSGAFTNAFDDLESFGGGFDVRATSSPAAPAPDLRAALPATGPARAHDVSAVSSHSVIPADARQPSMAGGYHGYLARGFDRAFFDNTTYRFAAIANGYRSAAEVWRALRERPGLAVVDANAAPRRDNYNFGAPSDFELSGFYVEDGSFAPVPLSLRDPDGGPPLRLTVIGVLSDTAPLSLAGIWTSQRTLAPRFGARAIPTVHLIALRPDVDATAAARALESRFVSSGMEADALSELLEDTVAANRTFNRLVQGFMALGLVVGVAALGVVTARSVVERRQQIGVLRAIGFRRRMIQATFLLESSFIALTSILVGSALGLTLAWTIIHDSQQQPSWSNLSFDVPWLNLGLIFLAVYLVALLTTLAPSRRAARVYPAEALRYE